MAAFVKLRSWANARKSKEIVDVLTFSALPGLIGKTLIGAFLQRGLYETLIAIPVLMALIALALIPFGPSTGAVVPLPGLWGLIATAAPVEWWSWIAQAVPHNAEAPGGLMVAVIQSAIAVGSTLGALSSIRQAIGALLW